MSQSGPYVKRERDRKDQLLRDIATILTATNAPADARIERVMVMLGKAGVRVDE